MKTYPVNLVLEDKLVILIGAKGEIERKVPGLLEVKAKVRVIAPTAAESIEQYAREGHIEWLARPYQSGDLAGAFMVIAATNNQQVHDAIWAEGIANNQLVNVMDVIPQCNFHGTSVVRRDQLTISIGTGGAAPALAATLRQRFENEFGPEYGDFLVHAQALRPVVAKRIHSFKHRVAFWYDLVKSDALTLIREGKVDLFNNKVQDLITQYE